MPKKFLSSHHYFHEVWCFLGTEQKRRVLNITADEQGIIPYENIVDMNSLFLTPEKGNFFEKSEFHSDLKKKAVSDEEYKNLLYLFKTLKIRNLGDMNNLYNAQDVILLCKIAENRFQYKHELYGFNLRRCNSASTLSGCTEREMSKVIIALPTSNESVEIFEETITVGFSSVYTRLVFDT